MYDVFEPEKKWIDTMQICKNGHVINDSFIKYPERNQDYCAKCGKETITECGNCNKSIPGRIHYPTWFGGSQKAAPDYCQYCNKPYLWNKGWKKTERDIKSNVGHLKGFIEWFAEVMRKLRKK